MTPTEHYWRAKRLCALARKAYANASRRERKQMPLAITVRRANRLQELGEECWRECLRVEREGGFP